MSRDDPLNRVDGPELFFNQAVHYLGKHSASKAHLKAILARKAVRKLHKLEKGEGFPDYRKDLAPVIADAIDAVGGRCVDLGYISDRAYGEMRFGILQRKGWPLARIQQDLRQKGVEVDVISALIAEYRAGEEGTADLDLVAAIAFARRRRFGAYAALSLSGSAKPYDKQLAAFMRAGFRYDLAEKVLKAESPDELLRGG